MTAKGEKDSVGRQTVIRLSGRLRSEHLAVTLVDVEVVRFLNSCEQRGVALLYCWPDIREWMIREQDKG